MWSEHEQSSNPVDNICCTTSAPVLIDDFSPKDRSGMQERTRSGLDDDNAGRENAY